MGNLWLDIVIESFGYLASHRKWLFVLLVCSWSVSAQRDSPHMLGRCCPGASLALLLSLGVSHCGPGVQEDLLWGQVTGALWGWGVGRPAVGLSDGPVEATPH